MKIEGSAQVAMAPAQAWQHINDPESLRRCTPGMTKLVETAPDIYEATIELALPAIRGRFDGTVEFLERRPSDRVQIRLQGKGPPGFVNGEVVLELRPADGGTTFQYSADVQVGGQIARLGQRMVSGMAKDMAAQFFEAFERLDTATRGEPVARSPIAAFFDLLWRSIKRVLAGWRY